jgi:hypothetical protein
MSAERELGDALLKLDIRGIEAASDARRMAERLFARDRRRIRILGGWAILFSLLSAAAFYGMFDILVNRTIPSVLYLHDKLSKIDAGNGSMETSMNQGEQKILANNDRTEAKQARTPPRKWYQSNTLIMWIGISSAAMIVFAAAATVGLIFASRWAALRQINASLLEISNQLKQLQRNKG